MTILVRRATSADSSALLELQAQVHDLHLAQRPDQFKPTEASVMSACFEQWLASPSAKIWVAERRGKVVGYAVELFCERAEGPYCPARRWCDVEQIAVDVAHRRAGVATALLQAVVSSARAAGLDEIELTSWAFNQDAHRAFESFGFTPKLTRFELRK